MPALNSRPPANAVFTCSKPVAGFFTVLLTLHFTLQILVPFRFVLYPNALFWTEQGYRFSWRVMLIEKAGHAIFRVHDLKRNKSWEVANWEYLRPHQEKMMATQPDMMLQFAHFLEQEFKRQGLDRIAITADAYVTLNGRRSRRFIDPAVDLTRQRPGFNHKGWVLPFDQP
jgi:hypothetical protein